MVVGDELKSQPYITIHYTYNEALEGVGCCELPKSVQTHSILVVSSIFLLFRAKC